MTKTLAAPIQLWCILSLDHIKGVWYLHRRTLIVVIKDIVAAMDYSLSFPSFDCYVWKLPDLETLETAQISHLGPMTVGLNAPLLP